MSFLFSCAGIYLLLFVLFLVIAFFAPRKFSCKVVFSVLFLYVVSLVIFAFFIKPPIAWDLYRHYISINTIRYGGMQSFLDDSGYGIVPVAVGLFYLVSLLPTNQFLPAIATAIEYALFCNILYNFYKSKKLRIDTLAFCIVAQLVFCPLIFSFSGIRNTLACSIFAYGVYMECFKKRKRTAFLFYAVAVATHTSLIILVALRILILLKSFKLVCALVFSWPILGGTLYVFLTALPIPFMNTIGRKLFTYTETIYALTPANVFAICVCVFLSAIWVCLSFWNSHKRKRFPADRVDLKLFLLLYFFTVSSCLYPHIASRMMYQIGFLFPFAIVFLLNYIPPRLKRATIFMVALGMGVYFIYFSRSQLYFYTATEMVYILS